jgi:hypothetical protein
MELIVYHDHHELMLGIMIQQVIQLLQELDGLVDVK